MIERRRREREREGGRGGRGLQRLRGRGREQDMRSSVEPQLAVGITPGSKGGGGFNDAEWQVKITRLVDHPKAILDGELDGFSITNPPPPPPPPPSNPGVIPTAG